MCHLNLLIKNNEINKSYQNDLLNSFNSATYSSFLTNNDNDGVFFDFNNSLVTSEKKINLFNSKELFYNSNFVLSHQRFATSGFNNDFAQPFLKNDFVFLHNGVISDYAKKGKSDTFNLFNNFLKYFNKYNKRFKKITAIKRSILKCLKDKIGTYSIGIFDIKSKELFYFKNDGTKINLYTNKKRSLLYLTTSSINGDFLRDSQTNLKEYKVKNFNLYVIKINDKDRISFKNLGHLNLKEKINLIKYNSYNTSGNYCIKRVKNLCVDCGKYYKKTYKYYGEYFCKDCYNRLINDWDFKPSKKNKNNSVCISCLNIVDKPIKDLSDNIFCKSCHNSFMGYDS